MQATQILLDGQDILHSVDYGIMYTQKDWKNMMQVSDAFTEKSGKHGRDTSATFARVRVITLAGWIDRLNNANELAAVKYLEKLLALQSNPSILSPRTLTVTDIYGRVWELAVKVKEPCTIEEGDPSFMGSHWNWRCVLESVDDPTYISSTENVVDSQESVYGGWAIPQTGFTFPIAFDDYLHLITLSPDGNNAVYPTFTFTATASIDTPLKIIDITHGTFFGLDVSATVGDVIVVNSKDMICTKNGVNINALRIIGSIWPAVEEETSYIFEDIDTAYTGSDFNVEVTYRNVLL